MWPIKMTFQHFKSGNMLKLSSWKPKCKVDLNELVYVIKNLPANENAHWFKFLNLPSVKGTQL